MVRLGGPSVRSSLQKTSLQPALSREEGNLPVREACPVSWAPSSCPQAAAMTETGDSSRLWMSWGLAACSLPIHVTLCSSSCLLSPAPGQATLRRAATLLPVLLQEQPCSPAQARAPRRSCLRQAAAASTNPRYHSCGWDV